MTTPTPDLPPVTFGIKVIADQGHVHFDLFAGRTPDARGRSGRLVLRADEFEEFKRRLQPEVIRYPLLHCLDCGCNTSTVGDSS